MPVDSNILNLYLQLGIAGSGGQGEKLANFILADLIWAGQISSSRGVKFVMRTDVWIEAEAKAIARGCLRYTGKDLPQSNPVEPLPVEDNTYFRVVVGSYHWLGIMPSSWLFFIKFISFK